MRRVNKPWGYELIWAETARYVGKILHIDAGKKLSRQYHVRKDETFLVQTGEMDLEVGKGTEMQVILPVKGPRRLQSIPPFALEANDSTAAPAGAPAAPHEATGNR